MSSSEDEEPIKLTAADLGHLRMKKKYAVAPDVVEFKLHDFHQVLPFVRCLNCNGNIFRQSQAIMAGIEEEQKLTRKKKGRDMDADEFNEVRTKLLDNASFRRPCCKNNAVEQLVMPDEVPASSDRYVPGPGDMRGNVRIRELPKKLRYIGEGPARHPAIPYNPYTVSVRSIKFGDEPEDDDEGTKRSTPPLFDPPVPFSDVYPSMPEIDSTFKEELAPVFKPEGREHVAGIVYTGVPGLESLLVRGRPIPAR